MKIKFVDLKRENQVFEKPLTLIIQKIFRQAVFILGEPLERFEKNFARWLGKKYAVGVNSGTDALRLGLIAYGIKAGDEVITVANTYFATAMVVSNIGAKPLLVDPENIYFNIDPGEIAKHITRKTKAIIPVHLFGQTADMDPIVRLAKKHKLVIIEDCCQAHGAKYKGKKLPYTETGAFSFYPGKNLGGFGDGGAIVTNNKTVYNCLKLLRNDGSVKKYEHLIVGFKSRLDSLQAEILDFKLKHLNTFIKNRRQAAALYNRYLAPIKEVTTPREAPYAFHVYHLYVIRCRKRDALQKYLAKKGIDTVIHYPKPIHLQKAYFGNNGYKKGAFPVAEKQAKEILSLPMFPEITAREIQYIAKTIQRFYKHE